MAAVTQLDALEFSMNNVGDISCLAPLTAMVELEFVGNPISDITALSGMPNLHHVVASNCQIDDIAPLVANPGLGAGDSLYLDGPMKVVGMEDGQADGTLVRFRWEGPLST